MDTQDVIKIYSEHKHLYGFHITSRSNLASIKSQGLKINSPEDYQEGDIPGIYLFKTLEDAQNALMNWLGERIEGIEEETGQAYDEICLKVNLTGLESNLIDSVEYEWTCIVNIEPKRILAVMEI